MAQPLSGIKVVEMGMAIQGPAAGVYLSDMGAEGAQGRAPNWRFKSISSRVNNNTPPETQALCLLLEIEERNQSVLMFTRRKVETFFRL